MSFFTTYYEPSKPSTTIFGKVFDVFLCLTVFITSLPLIIGIILLPIAVILHLFGIL